MAIELYTWVALTEDLPKYGLKKGNRAMVIEYYPRTEGQEDGYSLEGFGVPIEGVTVEVRASQIKPIAASTPAPYPSTDAAEQDALTTFSNHINTRYVKADIRTRDKFPNVDGTVELVNEKQVPYGKIEVQLRKLPAGKKSYSCPSSLVAYSTKSTLPVVLVCADPDAHRVFWRKISVTMPEYKEGQRSFTIHFDEIADCVDSSETYLQKWAEIIRDYQERVSQYPVLRKEIVNRLTLEGIPVEDRKLFQQYVETINDLLDNDFVVVKDILFPDVWKLGVGLFDVSSSHISYQLFKIPYGEPGPLICKLEGGFLLSAQPNSYAISDHLTTRESFADPQSAGQSFVLDYFEKIVEQRALPIHSHMAASEVMLTFIDEYYRCLGLQPDQHNYQIANVNYAINQHLIGICVAMTANSQSDFIYVDLDSINAYLAHNDVKPTPPSKTPVRFELGSQRISVRTVLEALRYLMVTDETTLTRSLTPRTQPLAPSGYWVWEGYSAEDEIHNVKLILERSIEEYDAFVQGSRLKLPRSAYLDPNLAIIYEYHPSSSPGWRHRPIITEHHVDNSQHRLPKLSVKTINDTATETDVGLSLNKRTEGSNYRAISASSGDATYLFDRTPFMNQLYRMLHHDLQRNYNMKLILDAYLL